MRKRFWVALAALAATSLGWATSAVAAPGMGWGQWTSPDLTFRECMTRTPAALKAEGLTHVEQHARVWFGTSSGSSSVIVCYELAKGTIVTVTVAAEGAGGPSGALAARLGDRIFTTEAPVPTPGSTALPEPTSPGAGAGTLENGWQAVPADHRGKNGIRFTYSCSAGGSPAGKIWGTDIYTDDSQVCTAAIHAGLIAPGKSGNVTIEIRPPMGSYVGSARNGITSSDYGGWHGSYVFVVSGKAKEAEPQPTGGRGWDTTATPLRGQNGKRFTWGCPAGGTPAAKIWGTGTYTDDSSVCTAAVHAGVITTAKGGTVTIEIRAGEASYQGSARNGITSSDYGSWSGSFVFVR